MLSPRLKQLALALAHGEAIILNKEQILLIKEQDEIKENLLKLALSNKSNQLDNIGFEQFKKIRGKHRGRRNKGAFGKSRKFKH